MSFDQLNRLKELIELCNLDESKTTLVSKDGYKLVATSDKSFAQIGQFSIVPLKPMLYVVNTWIYFDDQSESKFIVGSSTLRDDLIKKV